MKRLIVTTPAGISGEPTQLESDGSLDVHVTDGCLFAMATLGSGLRVFRGWPEGAWGPYLLTEDNSNV